MAEERTRVVPGAKAKAARDVITFQCDNGHHIKVSAKLAGKRGSCSKCGIPVVIPLPGVESAMAEGRVDVPTPPDTAHASTARPAAPPPAPEAATNLFEGLTAEPPPVADEIVVDITGAVGDAPEGGDSLLGDVVSGAAPEEFVAPEEVATENPTAQLVARLWLEREHGGIVELHLSGGGVILPEFFEARWSRGTHGLFASQAADGTVTLTAVAWDSIQKVVVRQVKGLPYGMFE